MAINILSAIEKILDSKFSNIQSEYLDIQGAALFLGVYRSTMYKLNHKKAIPFFKPDGSKRCYYLKSDLVEYMTKNRFMSRDEIIEKSNQHFQNKEGGNYVR